MEDVVEAAQNNNLDKLRRYIKLELAAHPSLRKNASSKILQAGCHAAALYNHPMALDLLLDSGCWIDDSKCIWDGCSSKHVG
jgi:hypothetical protein